MIDGTEQPSAVASKSIFRRFTEGEKEEVALRMT
jgi:hypothetical protein